ncbi:MAG: hypothetical protein ACRC5T_11000, partial [Cetobacterium sp.]
MIEMFNNYFASINAYLKEIALLKEEILFLGNVVSDKQSINKISASRVLEELRMKEKEVEKLLGNKKFKHVKFADFLSATEIFDSKDMEVFEKGGFVIGTPVSKLEQIETSRKLSRDRKELYIEFKEPIYTNEITFSFVDEKQIPIVPEKVFFTNEIEEELNEHDFRYYNRNESYNFVSNFYYYPKIVKSIRVTFKEAISSKNAVLKLYQNTYLDTGDSSFKLRFDLTKSTDNANIYVNSEESVVPVDMSFSIDDISYEDVSFSKKNEISVDFPK